MLHTTRTLRTMCSLTQNLQCKPNNLLKTAKLAFTANYFNQRRASGITDLRNDQDPGCTYEGENHVLIQQTSNILLKFWPDIQKKKKIASPLNSFDFISNGLNTLSRKWSATTIDDVNNLEYIIEMFEWITIYLIKATFERFNNYKTAGMDSFSARNNSQVYYSRSLGVAYIQLFTLNLMKKKISEAQDRAIGRVLTDLAKLYGVYNLEKHFLSHIYQGGFATGPEAVTLIQETVLKLCRDLKRDVVSLVDAIAPPDFLLRSVIGSSDGKVYENLYNNFLRGPGNMSKPIWWEDIVDRKWLNSKL